MQEQHKLKNRMHQEKVDFEQQVIENDKKDLEKEKEKRDRLQLKVLEAKKMRD